MQAAPRKEGQQRSLTKHDNTRRRRYRLIGISAGGRLADQAPPGSAGHRRNFPEPDWSGSPEYSGAPASPSRGVLSTGVPWLMIRTNSASTAAFAFSVQEFTAHGAETGGGPCCRAAAARIPWSDVGSGGTAGARAFRQSPRTLTN